LFTSNVTRVARNGRSISSEGDDKERRIRVRVIERVTEYYDVQEVEFGKVYRWCPELVVLECECGERATFKRVDIIRNSVTTCECGADRTDSLREALDARRLRDKELHPWRYDAKDRGDVGLPC